MNNPLSNVSQFGQSIWLDYIRRGMFASGELKKFIDEDDLRGMTSNPAIFEEAISRSDDYHDAIQKLANANKSASEILQTIMVEDVQHAADIFRPVYDATNGLDGYVSLEVSPNLAKNTEGTIQEARASWKALNRPNVMIKVPGTKEGLPAIQQLISEGINVNVTLLFSLERYRAVAEAYITGLEHRLSNGHAIDRVASVASFFLSRIDTLIDPQLEKMMNAGGANAKIAEKLYGEVAVASAKRAYQIYKEVFGDKRFKLLANKGAKPQRLLWASTSTKNPKFAPLKYVEALIGPDTVNTVPMETLKGYRETGNPASRLEQGAEDAKRTLGQLADVGITLDDITQQLETEGIDKFVKPFDKLTQAVDEKRKSVMA